MNKCNYICGQCESNFDNSSNGVCTGCGGEDFYEQSKSIDERLKHIDKLIESTETLKSLAEESLCNLRKSSAYLERASGLILNEIENPTGEE